jgi:cell division cycle protein 37
VPQPILTKEKKKTKVTEIEVLNPDAVASNTPTAAADEDDEDDEEGELPELTPALVAFSKIPLKAYDKSFEYIQHHREVFVPGASDALLVAAFRAQGQDKPRYAKQCIHQSLLLQYCEKLGKDGVGVFFKKYISIFLDMFFFTSY